MSADLGRFVAAAIRDKALEEVLQENDRLRAELARLSCSRVSVTGPGGSPVYKEVRATWNEEWERDSDICKCKVTDIERAELRVGNDYVLKFADSEKGTRKYYHGKHQCRYTQYEYCWTVDRKMFCCGWRPEIRAGSQTDSTYVEFRKVWVEDLDDDDSWDY